MLTVPAMPPVRLNKCRNPTRMHLHSHTHELTLGLSFVLGALHALEPGHGKTAMFVYLLGGKRSIWHPVVMGISTAFPHSVSLFAIAFGVHIAHHLIAGDHHHHEECPDHSHGHSHEHSACSIEPPLVQLGGFPKAHSPVNNPIGVSATDLPNTSPQSSAVESIPSPGSYRTTAILGLAVGLLPCPTALAAYFTGLSSGSPAAAYLIIGLFAAGIASSLSLVGILLQYFGEKFGRRTESLVSLPWNYIRSGLILGIGLIYLARLITDLPA